MIDCLRTLGPASPRQARFAALGILDIVYLKRVTIAGEAVFDIYAADGTYLARYADEAVARAAMLQQAIRPVSVH